MFYAKGKFGFFRNHTGQVAPFLILVAAVLLVAIVATMRIGEVAFSRIRAANVADGALISSTTSLCRILNQIRQISLGSGGLLLNYVALQVYLLAHGVWLFKGAPLATGFFINSMLTSRRLYREAKRLARDATKDLRISLWDRTLSGALVDEPKPFKDLAGNHAQDDDSEDEVNREDPYDPRSRVTYLNYAKWFKRDAHFTEVLRQYKIDHPEGEEAWYKENLYSYSWNRKKPPEGEFTYGYLNPGPPDTDYGSYLSIGLDNVPDSITIHPKRMPMLYFYTVKGIVLPGIIPHPYAWIKRIDIHYPNADEKSFGLSLEKPLYAFIRFPFFRPPQEDDEEDQEDEGRLLHINRIRIEGSIWRGYEPKLVQ